MHNIYLALGSNVGDQKKNIDRAVEFLKQKIDDITVAPLYRSKPMGVTDQPDFVNTALMGKTLLSPDELLAFVKDIEDKVGRIYRYRWGPREIDIDIIFYDDLVSKSEKLEIPHPRAHERDFVLKPLCDLSPEMRHPVLMETIEEILSSLPAAQRMITSS